MTLVAVVVALSLATIAAVFAINTFGPFGLVSTVDRSGPTLLERIRTLEEFTAAEANFVQDVDVEQDVRFAPGLILGTRDVALLQGTVRATVDFSDLDDSAIVVDDASKSVQVTLPAPKLSDPEVDEKSIRILSRERGILNRVGDLVSGNPADVTPLFTKAEEKIAQAAAETDLVARGKTNTEQWLRTFLGAAGFDNVTVVWT